MGVSVEEVENITERRGLSAEKTKDILEKGNVL
jgi:hypothetical protein